MLSVSQHHAESIVAKHLIIFQNHCQLVLRILGPFWLTSIYLEGIGFIQFMFESAISMLKIDRERTIKKITSLKSNFGIIYQNGIIQILFQPFICQTRPNYYKNYLTALEQDIITTFKKNILDLKQQKTLGSSYAAWCLLQPPLSNPQNFKIKQD